MHGRACDQAMCVQSLLSCTSTSTSTSTKQSKIDFVLKLKMFPLITVVHFIRLQSISCINQTLMYQLEPSHVTALFSLWTHQWEGWRHGLVKRSLRTRSLGYLAIVCHSSSPQVLLIVICGGCGLYGVAMVTGTAQSLQMEAIQVLTAIVKFNFHSIRYKVLIFWLLIL